MIPRSFFLIAAGAALAACQPAIPDSGRGAGFDDNFRAQRAARDAALTGTAPATAPSTLLPATAPISSGPIQPTPVAPAGSAAATAAQTTQILAATRPPAGNGIGNAAASNSGVEPVVASPSNPPPAVVNSAGISNENNFDAVSGQRSIEGDAARIAANRAQYEVVQPEALPDRVDSGPNIVAYALATSHQRGEKVYSRFGLNSASKHQRACGEFASADQAQIDFLARGGPARDRKGLDPDGDGYACDWDPTPFRRAAQG